MSNSEILEKFREKLKSLSIFDGDSSSRIRSDNFLHRFLKMNRYNIEKSLFQVHEYVNMRKKYNAEEILNETFPKEFTENFSIFLGGSDSCGRPIAIIPHVKTWKLKEALENGQEEQFVRYMMKWTFLMEKYVLDRDADYGILIVDGTDCFHTTLVNSMYPRSVQLTLRLFSEAQKTAPGLIGQIFIGNGPRIFGSLFNLARSMVNLTSDIQFLNASGPFNKWTEVLKKIIPQNGLSPHVDGTCNDFKQI